MIYKLNKVIVLFVSILLLGSCASRKDIIYLQDIEGDIKTETSYQVPTFKVDDRITINVSSLNPEAAKPYNLYITSFNTGGVAATSQQQQQSYLVDAKGEISFPQLGKLKVMGLTRIDLENDLETRLKPFLPDVKVNVQLVNFTISVLGEVRNSGQFIVNRDKINILQAIGLAGDLTIHGKRQDVKLLREVNGKMETYVIDLTKKDFLSSPYFYLKQNDILYISPNKPRVNASAASPTAQYIISATGLLITIISILTR